ncbi:MAG: peptide deformylase [Candidatus Faecousia sp.]|uniref:peptide deformylase n=1 Tax=Faecousia sp. TaxID=2952921 RepID=UPI002A8E1D19|nr:peptide deformylase [Candidatus Faecousia sp.]
MALRRILTVDDPALHKVCRPVTKFDKKLCNLLDDMKETLVEANGVGLAAPQVGILRRVIVIDTGEELVELINPKIVETSGEQEDVEGCLSVPGEYWLVKRPSFARVCATDRDGNEIELSGEGLTARCICHECDHLDGHIYTEIASRRLTDEELEEMRKESEA